jgi:hypothetical protein
VIELRRVVVLRRPGLARVHAHRSAAVIAFNHAAWIIGGNPQVVRIAVRRIEIAPRLAGVLRHLELHIRRIHHVSVLGVGVDLGVVPGALTQLAFIVHAGPRGARVVGSVHATLIGFNKRVHAARVGAAHGDTDVAPQTSGEPGVLRDFGPGIAAVGGLEHP